MSFKFSTRSGHEDLYLPPLLPEDIPAIPRAGEWVETPLVDGGIVLVQVLHVVWKTMDNWPFPVVVLDAGSRLWV